MTTQEVYNGSDGRLTQQYYTTLAMFGSVGLIAMNLFRAMKCSSRAKLYRRRSHKDNAYGRKQYSIEQLCDILEKYGRDHGIVFGWKKDPNTMFGEKESWVFYVDLPNGQCSFHSPTRGKGPAYHGDWDGQKGMSEKRILFYVDQIFTNGTNQIQRGQ